MNTPSITNPYKRHRFPLEIISHCVWLYCRFCLSYRDAEEVMAARGIIPTYEAVRYWCRTFGQAYANQLRRRHPRPGDKWHLDDVFLTIHGERYHLWRAVDQDGHILDILVQRRRDKKAAKTFFRKLLKGLTYVPRVIITDQLNSYGAAKRESLPGVEHRQHRYLNNRAENLTNRLASGNGGCRGLNPRGTRSAFSPPMVPSPNISHLGATGSLPPSIARRWGTDSRSGGKSQGWLLRHKRQSKCRCLPVGLVMALKHVI
jgi:putative transposase